MNGPLKILIVDDDPIVRELMRATLEGDGFQVFEAADGESALDVFAARRPDAMVVDVVMPRMDGFELVRELRRSVESSYVPVLMATGLDDIPSIAKAYDAGATDFISKPLDWVILSHRVRYMLRAARTFGRHPGPGSVSRGVVPFRDIVNTLKVLIVDDDPIIRTLMRATLESEGFDVIEASDGEEALTLWAEYRPDAIVADVMMPRMDGFELCRALRRRPDSAHIPVLMATGLDDIPSITRAYEAGATDFIAKPINWVILNHRVRYMLRAARAFEDLRENQQHLIAARDAAEAASRAKSEFLANMSHELRTPLNAIIGFSAMMCERVFGPMPDKYLEYAKDINDSGTHLLAIINDILDLTKAESNRLALHEEEMPVAPVAALSMSIVQPMASEGGVALTTELQDGLPQLFADPGKLRQILINLLSNAVKFTPPGGSVSLEVKTLGRSGDMVFRIQDTGIGIPPDKMAVALSPFGQVDSGLARKYNGVGLGLPLSKRLTELHGGTFEIVSEPDKGTLVTVRFPRDRVASQTPRRLAAQ